MSLLIGLPVHNNPTMPFMESMVRLQESLLTSGLNFDVLYTTGESLIQRARNNTTCTFMEGNFERLLFIDSDIEFSPYDVERLWNLDEDICCGSYPFKKLPIEYTTYKEGKRVKLDDLDEPTEVDYAATGFLMIKREVFEKFKEAFPEKSHSDERPDGTHRETFAWFDPRVTEGETAKHRIYLPEDYAFSLDARSLGYRIILDPAIKLKHHGIYGFGA